MPDLSQTAVHRFWCDYNDPFIYKVITFMEAVESWTHDGDPQLEAALQTLGTELDALGNIELEQEDDFIKLATSITTGRGLRVLMALDMAYPGAAAKVLMQAEESTQADNDLPGIFLRRNIVFERLRLMGRVFSPERTKLIEKALEDSGYDE